MSRFIAIDFETASPARDSACAIGCVVVEAGRVVGESLHLIRPPERDFWFTYLHGIRWRDVADGPDFAAVWPEIAGLFRGVDFIAAHNAGFDRGVLEAGCAAHGITPPGAPYVCTVRLARATWNLRPTKLPDVCGYLGIRLDHHHADSDARACAEIVIAAEQDGWRFAKPPGAI